MADDDEDTTVSCPVCAREFKTEQGLKVHLGKEHKDAIGEADPAEPEPFESPAASVPPKPKPRRTTRGSLAPQIRDAVLMTSAVAAVKDYRIYLAVEATVDEFAVAWDNVAKQSPTARRYIQGLLSGGVWISAFGATLVMAVTVAACTDTLPDNLAGLGSFALNKAGLEVQRVTPIPEPDPSAEAA